MRIPVLLALSLGFAGCERSEPVLTITGATVAAGPASAAVYATIDNGGGADRLTAIDVDDRMPISLHESTVDGGVVRMRAVAGLDIPAGGSLELKSGGAHGMAMGGISANEPMLPLTFRFERHAPISVSATVTGPGGVPREHGQ